MFPHVRSAKHLHDYVLWIEFDNGDSGEIDLKDELFGEMFEPLQKLETFKQFKVDNEIETIVWENGADFAPEFLHSKLGAHIGK